MRVALYTENDMVGGAERFVGNLARGLASSDCEVTMLAHDGPVEEFLRADVPAAHIVRLPAIDTRRGSPLANTKRLLAPTFELARALRASAPDVFHVSNGGYPGSDFCRAATMATRRPTLMSVHAAPAPRDPVRVGLHRAFDRQVWRSTDEVICATQFVADSLVELRDLDAAKARVIPYGVDDRRPAPAEAAALRERLAGEDELLVGMLSSPGSDAEQKGYSVLADAIAQLPESTRLAVVFVGLDPGPAYEQRLTAAPAAPRVTRAGRVEDVRLYLAAMDALCVPSTKYESLPLTILEAFCVGTAVIASRLSGIPEAVVDGEQGVLCEPGDPVALAEALAQSSRGALASMGAAGRRRFEERYSVERMVQSTLDAYQAALR